AAPAEVPRGRARPPGRGAAEAAPGAVAGAPGKEGAPAQPGGAFRAGEEGADPRPVAGSQGGRAGQAAADAGETGSSGRQAAAARSAQAGRGQAGHAADQVGREEAGAAEEAGPGRQKGRQEACRQEGCEETGGGGQTASLYFRAENLPETLSIQGTTSLQLGCAVRLDVMPSVQLFSASAGAPLKGKLALTMISSGGRLGTISPKSALDAAKTAARAGAKQVAGKLGVIGKQLESQISDL